MSERMPKFGAQFDAMFREAVKDIRQSFNEVMMGKPEHAPEMGAPMNPTPQIVTDDLGFDNMLKDYASRPAPEQDRGMDR